jgi:hypothetical protein
VWIESKAFACALSAQGDGNGVISIGGEPVWATGTVDNASYTFAHLVLQNSDCNLVSYSTNGSVLWSSGALLLGGGACQLVLQESGDLVVLSPSGSVVWHSNTARSLPPTQAPLPAYTAPSCVCSQCTQCARRVIEGGTFFGLQNWFGCPGDGVNSNWRHYASGNQVPLTSSNIFIEGWPDTSEFEADALCDTGLTLKNGSPAMLYSAVKASVTDKHMQVQLSVL